METKCIWWDGYHNAFTDIIRFRDNFFVTFRHATMHAIGGRGKIYVIKSQNANDWKLVTTFPGFPDSRDPKLFVFNNKLWVVFFAVSDDPEFFRHWVHVYISYSEDGVNFSRPVKIENYNLRFWRIRNYKNVIYAATCRLMPDEMGTFLFRSENGIKFDYVSTIVKEDHANEADLLFEDDTCYAFVRREDCKTPVIAISKYPFEKWQRYTMNFVVRGPHIFKFKDKIYCTGRVFLTPDGKIYSYIKNETEYEPKTAIFELDRENMIFKPIKILPSGGDTSYCGSMVYKGKIYISYYSQHELGKRKSKVKEHAAGIYLYCGNSIE
ncbi:MAG: hypothetical protein N2115_01440 [bacterium]|nr:hypothetical protein [bacterium]